MERHRAPPSPAPGSCGRAAAGPSHTEGGKGRGGSRPPAPEVGPFSEAGSEHLVSLRSVRTVGKRLKWSLRLCPSAPAGSPGPGPWRSARLRALPRLTGTFAPPGLPVAGARSHWRLWELDEEVGPPSPSRDSLLALPGRLREEVTAAPGKDSTALTPRFAQLREVKPVPLGPQLPRSTLPPG